MAAFFGDLIMTNHIHLRIYKTTTAENIDHFLLKAGATEKSLGALHIRAYKTTETKVGSAPCEVTILYLRSGRESPLEWLRNTFNRKSQYALAAKMLKNVGKFSVDPIQTSLQVSSTRPKYIGVPLSKLLSHFAPSPPIPQPALVTLSPDGFVKNQHIYHSDFLGQDTRCNATESTLDTSEDLLKSIAELTLAPVAKDNFANFLNNTACHFEDVREDFESFASLAAVLYNSELPAAEFVKHIKDTPDLFSLLGGATQFSLRWAKCWDLNTELHNAMPYFQIALIDRFVIRMAKNYLSQHLDCDALEALAQWSPPASELGDVRNLKALHTKKTTT